MGPRADSASNETLSPLEILKRENELLRQTIEATGGLTGVDWGHKGVSW